MLPFYASLTSFFSMVKKRVFKDETGATAVEYGLIIGLIAVVVITGLLLLGPAIRDLFTDVAGRLP
ncbi:Flp family type IVb pilin [Arthrobacter mobilis]|uniref:Flp family type IVb pilin n=1 Tax=Arthrobacter mobilis TaxID=2724944 RepID=A0A7X6K7S0_9MICC|nr:Flp family type IVb pilin [Arthrobacter mobilis]NKX56725.1 Flp family type IVb pilin [Arthrobacter mobilis]